MQAPQRGDMEQRPLIVVAERSETAEEGPRLMDFAVACYRLRWLFVLVWASVLGFSIVWMPLNSKDRFTWTLVVHVADSAPPQPGNLGLQPLMTEWLATAAASGASALELNYLKVGSGAKAELLKTGIVATAIGDSEQQPPRPLEDLRSVAGAWAERQITQWKQEQQDIVAMARKGRDAILTEAAHGSGSTALAAAELALAQAEAGSRFPPQYNIASAPTLRVPSTFRTELARRVVSCLAVSAVVVLSLIGWSRLRQAAASR